MTAANLQTKIEVTSPLSIVHCSEVKPHYYVFNAEIVEGMAKVEFMDENWHEETAPTITGEIRLKTLVGFVDDTYTCANDDGRSSQEYLLENIDEVVTEFLNSPKYFSTVKISKTESGVSHV